jgi:hypothetical protein
VRGRCPARAQRIVDIFQNIVTLHEIDDAHLSELYLRVDEIEQACRDYRLEALRRAMMGRKIAGHKLVRGHRGKRQWSDPAQAEIALSLLADDDKIYQPREIISPTEAEKRLKANYASLTRFVTQSNGALSLAPEDDPRTAVEVAKFDLRPEELL